MKNIKGSKFYVTFTDGFGEVVDNCISKNEVRHMDFSYLKAAGVKIKKIEQIYY